MKKYHLVIGLLACGFAISAQARVHNYGADLHESDWIQDGSPVNCQLRHQIPNYGEAIFSKSVDQDLQFSISVSRSPKNKDTEATLQSHPPVWKRGVASRDLGTVGITSTSRAFNMGRDMARRLLLELEEGMFPTLYYSDWADGKDEVNVAISAVNFHEAQRKFLTCLSGLLPYGYEDIKSSRLQFPYKKIVLTGEVKQQLDKIAKYLKGNTEQIKVRIDGHSDSRGLRRHNYKISLKRANIVKAYLIKKGVKANQITVRGFGESKPIVSNRTRKGRAKNRRVEVTLLK